MDLNGVPYGSLRNEGYRPRVIDGRLSEDIEDFGAVCLEGAKYCGKTWTGRAFSNSEFDLMDPRGNFQNLDIATLDPSTALSGLSPRLIDEWQEAPLLWDGVRNRVDRSAKRDTFVLTGSSIPRRKTPGCGGVVEPLHSGVGRIEKMRMRPMTLFESGESNGAVSLRALFDGASPSGEAPDRSLGDICEMIVRGGWPASLGKSASRSSRVVQSYVREICDRDISRVDGIDRSPGKVRRLLHSLARNAEQATKSKTMIADMTETATEGALAMETVNDYLEALRKIFIIEEIAPWSPHLRSPLRINKRSKYHFVDPSIPAAILGVSGDGLSRDLNAMGFLFECLCVRDLLVYAEAMDAQVRYYRDQASLEVDVVIEAADGRWAAIEVKLGHSKVEEGAVALRSMAAKVQAAGAPAPSFLGVVEGLGNYAYRREDGILVLPICTLAP